MWSYNETSSISAMTVTTARSTSSAASTSGTSRTTYLEVSDAFGPPNTQHSVMSSQTEGTSFLDGNTSCTIYAGNFTITGVTTIGTATLTVELANFISSAQVVSSTFSSTGLTLDGATTSSTFGSNPTFTDGHDGFNRTSSITLGQTLAFSIGLGASAYYSVSVDAGTTSSETTTIVDSAGSGTTLHVSSTHSSYYETQLQSTIGDSTYWSSSTAMTTEQNGTTTFTESGSTLLSGTRIRSTTYNSTTITDVATITTATTATSTRSSVYPVSGTTTGATQSTSSVDTFTSLTTSTFESTITTYSTDSIGYPAIISTIFLAAESDWPWIVTTNGTSVVTANGVSFTETTLTNNGEIIPRPSSSATVSVTSFTGLASSFPRSTLTYTFPSFIGATTTSTVSSTTTSTYQIGGPASAFAQLSYTDTTSTVTVSYITSRSTVFSFTSTSSTSASSTISSVANSTTTTTQSNSVVSTTTNGTVVVTVTYILPSRNDTITFFTFINGGGTVTSSSTFTSPSTVSSFSRITSVSTSRAYGYTFDSVQGSRTSSEHSSIIASTPTHVAATLGAGYQVWPDVGRGQPIGTNVSAGFSIIIPRADGAFGLTLFTPELFAGTTEMAIAGLSMTSSWDAAASAANITYQTTTGTVSITTTATLSLMGSVPTDLVNSRQTTFFGGYGWDATATTTFTNSIGAHRATVADSSSFTTTDIVWNAASSFQITDGQAIKLQVLPEAAFVSSTTANNPYLNWPRFPVT